MEEVKVTFKNCPPHIWAMFEAAFKDVPAHLGEPALEIPADGLTIDFKEITEGELLTDVIGAVHLLTMANGWIALQKRNNEKQGH